MKKKHDNEIADKDKKINELTEQVAILSTQNKQLRVNLDEIHGQLEEKQALLEWTNGELKKKEAMKTGSGKDALTIYRLREKCERL